MSEYKIISKKPAPRPTDDKNSHDTYSNESDCVKEIIKIGVGNVRAIEIRANSRLRFVRLKGPDYLRLWKEYSRQIDN